MNLFISVEHKIKYLKNAENLQITVLFSYYGYRWLLETYMVSSELFL